MRRVRAAERAVLVGLAWGGRRAEAEAGLQVLALLAESAGAEVAASLLQERQRPDPATFIGSGKLAEVGRLAEEAGAGLVLFDDPLSPAQQRNLERALERKVLDRSQLILDIFAQRARSREGRLQVELAQLEDLLPRLAGKGVALSRLGGGIGTRGPGETKLETDRRRIRTRIQVLRRELEHVGRVRRAQRRGRTRRGAPVVALVGYTNAGKSTLFNALTGASARADDRLFMTLDPLCRRLAVEGGAELLLVDTVGFIRKLPHGLVAAFRATLEEVVEADLLLHVVDGAADDFEAQSEAVRRVLAEIGAQGVPQLLVFNKRDLCDPVRAAHLGASHPEGLLVSAQAGEGLSALRAALMERLELTARVVRLRFPAGAEDLGALHALGRVLSQEQTDGQVEVEAELPGRWLARFEEYRIA